MALPLIAGLGAAVFGRTLLGFAARLMAGLGIGFGIGFGLDTVFGTMPFMMLIFTLLGLAAGIKTTMRTSAEFSGTDAAGETPATREGDGAADQ